jgi:hypothetical protein
MVERIRGRGKGGEGGDEEEMSRKRRHQVSKIVNEEGTDELIES